MKINKTLFEGLYLINNKIIYDQRGSFSENFNSETFKSLLKINDEFCQDNIVYSNRNVLRGLHFQKEPYAQSKLITVLSGEVLDIAVDIREKSATYGKYFSFKITENNVSLFIPKGFAHGYLSLTDNTIVKYKVDNYYNRNFESGISFEDPILDIDWQVEKENLIISKKDKGLKNFEWKL